MDDVIVQQLASNEIDQYQLRLRIDVNSAM